MIELKNIEHYYGDFHSLKNVSFSVPKGSICGFIGPNGAGKSTVIKTLAGFLIPLSGEVWVGGVETSLSPIEARKRTGYMPETPYLYRELRVGEYLDFVGKLKGLSTQSIALQKEKLIHDCGLQKIIKKLIGSLSKGNRQRVALAQAMLGKPQVLLLDEPTSALDPGQVLEIRDLIKNLRGETTVLMSSHILSEISQICDSIVYIRDGKIQYQGPAEYISQKSTSSNKQILLRFQSLTNEIQRLIKDIQGASVKQIQDTEVYLEVSHEETFFPELYRLVDSHKIPLREIVNRQNILESFFANENLS